MGPSYTESARWIYSRNMFSCIWCTAARGYEKSSCRPRYYRGFIWSRPCSNRNYDFIPSAYGFLPLGAFLGAFITAMVIYALSWQKGASPSRIVLVGVSINALIGAATSALMLLHSDKVQSVLPWLAGGIGGVSWAHLNMIIYYAIFAIILAFFGIKHIRVLMLGDEMAKLLGHNVERSRFYLIVVSTLLAGIAVSVSGLIGFVGLVVPHMLRLLVGNDYKYLLPLSCLGGGILLVFADAIARSWFDPIELPVGILLSFLGGPFFLYLIHRGGKQRDFR